MVTCIGSQETLRLVFTFTLVSENFFFLSENFAPLMVGIISVLNACPTLFSVYQYNGIYGCFTYLSVICIAHMHRDLSFSVSLIQCQRLGLNLLNATLKQWFQLDIALLNSSFVSLRYLLASHSMIFNWFLKKFSLDSESNNSTQLLNHSNQSPNENKNNQSSKWHINFGDKVENL